MMHFFYNKKIPNEDFLQCLMCNIPGQKYYINILFLFIYCLNCHLNKILYVHESCPFFNSDSPYKIYKTHWTYYSIMLKSLNQPTEFSFLILITNSSEAQFLSIQKISVINDKMLRYLLVFLIWLGLGQVGLDVGQRPLFIY